MARGQRPKPTESDTSAKKLSGSQMSSGSLRQEIREAMLTVLRDVDAPATARASAARTLAEFCLDDDQDRVRAAPVSELSVDDIDAELTRLGQSARD
jgi:hypothetical protein